MCRGATRWCRVSGESEKERAKRRETKGKRRENCCLIANDHNRGEGGDEETTKETTKKVKRRDNTKVSRSQHKSKRSSSPMTTPRSLLLIHTSSLHTFNRAVPSPLPPRSHLLARPRSRLSHPTYVRKWVSPHCLAYSLTWFMRRVPYPRTCSLASIAQNAISAKRCTALGRKQRPPTTFCSLRRTMV